MTRPDACRACGRRPLRPRSRADLPGVAHAGRGLCRPCWRSVDLEDFAPLGRGGLRTGRPAVQVAEDVADLGAERAAIRVGFTARSRRSVAHELGVSLSTLNRALYRAADREAA